VTWWDSIISDNTPTLERGGQVQDPQRIEHLFRCFAAQTIGDNLVDSIISDNIPTLGEEAKFNELVTSSLKRIEARRACR